MTVRLTASPSPFFSPSVENTSTVLSLGCADVLLVPHHHSPFSRLNHFLSHTYLVPPVAQSPTSPLDLYRKSLPLPHISNFIAHCTYTAAYCQQKSY